MMRILKVVCLLGLLLCLVCSCTKGEDHPNQSAPPAGDDSNQNVGSSGESLIALASKTYEQAELLEIVQYKGTLDALNEAHPIECMRELPSAYRVSYLGERHIAVLTFDKDGNNPVGYVYSAERSKSDFEGLVEGMTLSDVLALDAEGEYLFLQAGRNDAPKTSTHCTSDGYLITVTYSDENVILHVTEELV